jgi:hypothetical protein
MDQRRTDKKVLESEPEGRRRKGRSRLRWLEDVEKHLRKMKAVDREVKDVCN